METTLKHLNFITAHTEATIRQFNEQGDITTIQYFCLGLVERLCAASKGLRLLIEKIEEDYYLEYSAGLIIRTTFLDFLFVLKAYDIREKAIIEGKSLKESVPMLTKYCNEVFADGIDNALRYVSGLKQVNAITEDETHNFYKNFANKYSVFVGEYKDDNVKPTMNFEGKHSPSQLFRQLSQHPILKQLAMNYDTYLLYSKYEHFSILSYDVIRREIEKKEQKIQEAIKLFALHNFIICSLLADYLENNFTITQHKSAGEYIETEIFNFPPNTMKY